SAPHARERVPRPRPAGLGGLQQERARPAVRERPVEPHRGLTVGEQPAGDRHHRLVEGAERLQVRHDLAAAGGAARGRRRRGHDAASPTASAGRSPTTASRGVASKQVRSPVWQAAPTWSTLTSTVSPSQSSATDLTYCAWPDVAPLTQYSCLLRLQNVHRPVVSVRCSASSSIQPTMSTSAVSCCCTTAATRPAESRLRRAAMAGSS